MASFSQFGNDLYTGKRSFDIVGRRKLWYTIALVMVACAIVLPFLRGGFQFGIEFRGGSEFQVAGVADLGQDGPRADAQTLAADTVTGITAIIRDDTQRWNEERQMRRRLAELEAGATQNGTTEPGVSAPS